MPTSAVAEGAAAGPAELLRSMTGRRKAAVLLLQLDRRASANVLAQLRESELEDLSAEIARIGEITPAMSAAVLREFGMLASGGGSTLHG
ncbi:MAG: flagellar motor switch protein FliG, partial [Pseudonocardiales bacterium]|nr:flagellar motor switch protein FliG [Pseudonocardiales bacterium]